MAIAGTWKAGAVTPSEYAGALRQGTGINPIHSVRDPGSRETGIKENLLPLGTDPAAGGIVPEELLGPEMWGYSSEEAAAYPGEDYRYLEADHPNWDQGSVGRPDRDGGIMTEGVYPQPEGWPSWGPHGTGGDPDFPLQSWPGGEDLRAYSDGTDIEKHHAIAIPTPGWRGGWINKAHGLIEEAETSDPAQYEINTSMNQLHRSLDNNRAVGRGTDDPRSDIATRLTGQKIRHYAMSSGMGGGPGTPDMAPVTQNLPYRPWYFRTAGTPPPPDTYFGTMTAFDPIERTLPVNAGEYVVSRKPRPTTAPTATARVITLADGGGAKLPGVGHVSKRWLMIVGGASVLSIGYFLYRRKQSAAAAVATPAPSSDTTGKIDPVAGAIAGSAQDQMDLASLQDGGYGTQGGYYAGAGSLGTSGVTPPVPGTGGFTTNGQWAQQAEQDLGGLGIDQVALAGALGHYLTGSPLSTAEQSLVDQAIAEENYPPVAGPGNYPPSMHTTATSTAGTGTTTATTGKLPAPTGLHVSPQSTTAPASWNAVPGATGYKIVYWRLSGGSAITGSAPTPYADMGHLMPKQRYDCYVYATGPSGNGAHSPAVSFTTT